TRPRANRPDGQGGTPRAGVDLPRAAVSRRVPDRRRLRAGAPAAPGDPRRGRAERGELLPRRQRTVPRRAGPGSGRGRGGGTPARGSNRDVASERLREPTRTRARSTGPRQTARG